MITVSSAIKWKSYRKYKIFLTIADYLTKQKAGYFAGVSCKQVNDITMKNENALSTCTCIWTFSQVSVISTTKHNNLLLLIFGMKVIINCF